MAEPDCCRVGEQIVHDRVELDADQPEQHGVEQVDQHLPEGEAEQPPGLVRIVGRPPDAVARDPHGPEAQTVNLEVAPDGEGVHPTDASDGALRAPRH